MSSETKTINPDEPRKSQAMQDFEDLIERLANEATAADRAKIADLVNPEGTVRIDALTPAQAAVATRMTTITNSFLLLFVLMSMRNCTHWHGRHLIFFLHCAP